MISAIVLSAAIFAASSQELMHRSKSFGMGANLLERAAGKRSLEQLRKSGARYLSDLQRLPVWLWVAMTRSQRLKWLKAN